MATNLTTSYQYIGGYATICSSGSYTSRLYLQAKINSQNSDTKKSVIGVRISIQNNWLSWNSDVTKIYTTGAETKYVYGTASQGKSMSVSGSGSSSYVEKWSAETSITIDHNQSAYSSGNFTLGASIYVSITGQAGTKSISPVDCHVTVPAPTTWTVSYNANGGTGAPGNQTKTKDVTLTLSSTTPTRASETTTGATVTFSDSVGTPAYSTYTTVGATISYTFDHWNTKQDNTGTNYAAGGSYTANEGATLYAQWSSGSQTDGKVQLPQSIANSIGLNKYFVGWTTVNGDESTLVQNGYVATRNITLYALWKNIDSAIKYRTVGGSWINF